MPWFILTIIAILMLGDALWWFVADRWLRPLRRAWLWRSLLGLFVLGQMGTLFWVILQRAADGATLPQIPTVLLAATYLWHLLLLPAVLVLLIIGSGGLGLWRLAGLVRSGLRGAVADGVPDSAATGATGAVGAAGVMDETAASTGLSRRQILGVACAAAPTLLLGASLGGSVLQHGAFRVRRIDVDLPGLPPALEGLRIAHVSDLHVGRFTEGRTLRRIVEATNRLQPDLVLLPGDLINNTLTDLPEALDAVESMESRHGAYLCLGNHDLIDDGMEFVARTRARVPLLIDESRVITVRGVRVEILGLSWHRGEEAMAGAVRSLAGRVQPGAFPILLAHHPHAFDAAAESGIPLTVAGHTHGGQLMLPGGIGFGPLMYRYWSGLYRKPQHGAAIVVSNGAGNWLPFRANAPAEIIEMVLHRA